MTDAELLTELIQRKERLVAMLAPSFPVVFDYPHIITVLKKLGFAYTAEVAVGAECTNRQLLHVMTDHPDARYITSPCPTLVRLIRRQLPQYAKYLTDGVDSPMIATAKIVRERYPGYRPVFIGPCFVKKYEAKEDAPDLQIVVLTFAELQEVINAFDLNATEPDPNDHFDISTESLTKLFALDGGLTKSSGVTDKVGKNAVKIVSGPARCVSAIREFDSNSSIRLMDILNCEGGCIMGPGIRSTLPLNDRKNKILAYFVREGSKRDINASF